jgi:hypothetical protein
LFPLVWFAATDKERVLAQCAVAGSMLGPQIVSMLDFATVVAAVVAFAPVLFAMVLSQLSGDKMSWRWPFQKEKIFGVFGRCAVSIRATSAFFSFSHSLSLSFECSCPTALSCCTA